MTQISETQRLSMQAAETIRQAFDDHTSEFLRITARAKERFEKRDWRGLREDTLERLDLYEKSLTEVDLTLKRLLGTYVKDRPLWIAMKGQFLALIYGRHDAERAETYFNSVTRKVLETVGIDREIEYFHLDEPVPPTEADESVCRRYPKDRETKYLINTILADLRFEAPFEDVERDAELVAREIDLYLWPIVGYNQYDAIEVIRPLFYRNKVAYLVGRIRAGTQIIPLILPLYNNDRGIYVDAVLLSREEAGLVFSFAHSYFHVVVERHDVVIAFLQTILTNEPIAELYISLGYNKHGKTEFYRSLHHFVHESKEQFVIAPGREGAVMITFTLPDFRFVFKVIKDTPCFLRTPDITPKTITRREVMHQYNMVCHRDRVGRMVDTQEFENLRFRKKRFSEDLLEEFRIAAREAVNVDGDYVVVHHCYLQRRVIPLLIYLQQEKNPETVRRVVIDFGYFLKDLAAAGIFPSDLFNIWNYGVTRRGRVVLFDYDDVQPLEKPNFRIKPQPQDDCEEMESEQEWVVAMPDDFFMDEIERYSGIPEPLRATFNSVHADLYTVEFWRDLQRRVREGEIVDIVPYNRSRSFHPQS